MMVCVSVSRAQGIVEWACKELGLEVAEEHGRRLELKVLPGEGLSGAFDGGFAACLRRRRAMPTSP